MGHLFLVGDNVTEEELLNQIFHKFTARNKKNISGIKQGISRLKVKKLSTMSKICRQKKNKVPVLLSTNSNSMVEGEPSTSVSDLCKWPLQTLRETSIECEIGSLKKTQSEIETPGNATQSISFKDNRKRTHTCGDKSCTDFPKRSRKNSCEILKEQLKKKSSLSESKSTLDVRLFKVADGATVCTSEHLVDQTSNDLATASSDTVVQHKHRKKTKGNVDKAKSLVSGSSHCCHNSNCTVRPNTTEAKRTKTPYKCIVDVSIDEGCSKCDNGADKHTSSSTEAFSSSDVGGGSEFRTISSEKAMFGDEGPLWMRVFDDGENDDGISATASAKEKGQQNGVTSHVDTIHQPLPAIVSIPDWMYVGLDCEMVGVGHRGKQNALARCSIVDYSGNVVYDEYVRPSEAITDYRTPWSGIRASHMKAAIPIHQALHDIHECLAHKIVVGHSVYGDFKVLGVKPDHHFVRDTYQCPPLVAMAGLEGRGNSLKKLSEALLGRQIQVGKNGHCSVEDARATLDLFKLVRDSWEPTLYSKWSRKDRDVCSKIANYVAAATRHREQNSNDDFLDDEFWPGHVVD